MPPLSDQGETQRVDADDDDAAAADYPSSWDATDDDEALAGETERVTEDMILYGETQAPDDGEDFEFDNGIGTWMKTQAVEEEDDEDDGDEYAVGEWNETQIVDYDEREIGEGGDLVEGARVFENLADSDASTDDESGSGGYHVSGVSCKSSNGPVKSFTAVRTAALRSSGLAAAAKVMTSKAISTKLKSSVTDGGNCKDQDNCIVAQTGTGACGMVKCPNIAESVAVFDTKVGELYRDDKTEKSQNCTQDYNRDESESRINNPVVKKLLYEQTAAEEEATDNLNDSTLNLDLPDSLAPDNVAGLSYLGSQEPGDLSQANALDVVDKFLGVNDMGLSQEANAGKTDTVNPTLISSAKGAQCLAKITDHRSPIEKTATFEWFDSLEDEEGGEFFAKKRDSFFKNEDGAWRSRSQPPKPRHVNFGPYENKVSGEDGVNRTNHRKIARLSCSDSKLIRIDALKNEKLHAAETRPKKNLLEDLNEQPISKFLQEQQVSNVDRDENGLYEVGPDTQMAAEAMEELVFGLPINHERIEAIPATEKTTKVSSRSKTSKKTPSKCALSGKSSFCKPKSNDISAHSKRRKILPVKSKKGSTDCSRSNSREKQNLKRTASGTKSKRVKKKLQQNLNIHSSANKNQCSVSFEKETSLGQVGREVTKGVGLCDTSFTLNVQLSVGKELVQGEFHVNSTPVARRTRHSRAVKQPKLTENMAIDYGKGATIMRNVRTKGVVAGKEKLAAYSGGLLTRKRKSPDIDSDKNAKAGRDINKEEPQDIEGRYAGEDKAGSHVKDSVAHPKRRRTRHTSSDNLNAYDSLNNLSLPGDNTLPVTEQRTIPATFRSVSEILDAAKRKRRSVSSRMTSEFHCLTSAGVEAVFVSGARTRSSLKSLPVKSNTENGPLKCVSVPVINGAGSGNVGTHSSTPSPNQRENSHSHVAVTEKIVNLEELPKEKHQTSGVACTTPSKDIDAVSPVCVADDHPRIPGNKGRSRRSLITRELIHLKANKSSPTLMFNMRRRKDMANIRVLFSHHLDEDIIKQQKKIMGRLGVSLAFSISDATHFITDNFVRTRNMLEAMALGKPVVTHMWLESCGQASCFIDEKSYILRDAKKEKDIGFSMPVSLARASESPLLQGRRVYITPNTKPSREVISSLVKAAQGQPLERIGRSAMRDDKVPEDLLILSCEEDYSICMPLLEKGAEIFSSELLLNGIVIQKLEYERHRLLTNHVKKTRSTLWLRQEGNRFVPVGKCI